MKSNKEEEIEMDDYEKIFDPYFKSQFNINESKEYLLKEKPSFDLDNTYATCEIDSQVTKVDISFISYINNEEKEKEENSIKCKEMTKETIEFLEKCCLAEKSIMTDCINRQKNFGSIKSIKELKNILFSLDKNINSFMKMPYMRKYLDKFKNNCIIDYDNIKFDEEKIKFGKIENHNSIIKNKL
jgi:hypothetical protein